ncbi:MAG TPA: substrate-binding domain-containing protein [Lacunisphaera sp.]|nr:substrate-binding domain-containing protein [Lacunisphaera sp.]
MRLQSLILLAGLAALAARAGATENLSSSPADPNRTVQGGSRAAETIPAYTPQGALTGELHAMGTDVMDTLTLAWLEIFRKAHPQVEATQEARGANTVFPGLMSGASQLGPLSREASAQEVDAFTEKFGYPPTAIRVALGTYDVFGLSPPIVIFVHRDNPLEEITLEQLEEIYARDGKITTWGQLGLTGEWAHRPIALWGLRSPNGTATFFQSAGMHGRDFRPTMILRPTADGLSRSAQRAANGGVQAFVDTLAGVAQDRFALGYAAPGYNPAGVKMLALVPGAGVAAVSPTRENVASLRYPLCRFAYLYLDRAPGKALGPNVKEFLRIVLSQQGQELVALRSGFLPLPARIVREELAKLDRPFSP